MISFDLFEHEKHLARERNREETQRQAEENRRAETARHLLTAITSYSQGTEVRTSVHRSRVFCAKGEKTLVIIAKNDDCYEIARCGGGPLPPSETMRDAELNTEEMMTRVIDFVKC